MKLNILIILLSIALLKNSWSQDSSFFQNRMLEGKFHYGFLWPHHSAITYSINGRVPAFEINLLNQGSKENSWDNAYRYPRTGVGFSHFYMHKHDVFGSALGAYGLIDIPVLRVWNFTSTYRIYGGLSWLTEKWDLEENYLETAIGTHVNLYFSTAFTTRCYISDMDEITWDLSFTHFSNGNIKRPNLGLNLVTTSFGYIHSFGPQKTEYPKPVKNPPSKKVTLNIWYSGGVKAENNYKNDYFYKSAFKLHGGYNVNKKRQFGVGADLFYDGTRKFYRQENDSLYQNPSDLWQIGLVGYQDLKYKNLILTLQTGFYVYHQHDYHPVYNRIGLKYKTGKNTFISVCLKSHKTQADYIEWGIGYLL